MKKIKYYQTKRGKSPFIKWLKSIKDKAIYAKINNRISRLSLGHYGDYKIIGDGLIELRIHLGPGYRIYMAEIDDVVILLLNGGSKTGQQRDIDKAKQFWHEFKEQYYES